MEQAAVGRPRWTYQAQRQDRKLSKLHKNSTRPIGARSQNPERPPQRPIGQRLLANVVRSRSQMDAILIPKPKWTLGDEFTTDNR